MKQIGKNQVLSYDEYILMQFKDIKTDSYDRIVSCGAFKVNDLCRVVTDWCPELKKYKCRISYIQKNGNSLFAYVKWIGLENEMIKKYGCLWNLDELIKV